MSIGMISNLPKSISSDSMIFENDEKAEKLLIGPTASIPGPILLRHAITALRLVSTLKSSNEMSRHDAIVKNKYSAR